MKGLMVMSTPESESDAPATAEVWGATPPPASPPPALATLARARLKRPPLDLSRFREDVERGRILVRCPRSASWSRREKRSRWEKVC